MKLNQICNNIKLTLSVVTMAVMFNSDAFAAENVQAGGAVDAAAEFAKVGDVVITYREFNALFAAMNRGEFYHGKPPEARVATLQRETADKIINNILLVTEAKRRKIKPENVSEAVKQFDKKNASNPNWPKVRDQAIAAFTKQAQEASLLSLIEKQVRKIHTPSEKQVRAYYAAHPEKFTEPEQLRVALILLKVEPGEVQAWGPAAKQAEEWIKELRAGADFAEYAKKYSDDRSSAEQGGDMGYLHGGMLAGSAAEAVSKLKIGEISDPAQLLEGVGIFKLIDRKEAKLNSFAVVKGRATELLTNEESDRAWKELIAKLRKQTTITVDESHFAPLPEAAAPAAPAK